MPGSITRDGGDIVIRIPVEEAQALRVALQPCPCRAPKSNATKTVRERLVEGIGRAIFAKPKPSGRG